MTSDALPHGECRRDASVCEGETNCELHFPSIANCTGSGVDSFVYLGAYQPLYYTGDLDAPLRYDPSSGALLCADKFSRAHHRSVRTRHRARTQHEGCPYGTRAAWTCLDQTHMRAMGASRWD